MRIVNKYIPTSETDTMDEVCCNSQVSINLFSNVLDIQTLSLKWLAEKTGMLANINYMVCIGPKFYSNTRIADFCGYFQPKNYFSNQCIPLRLYFKKESSVWLRGKRLHAQKA